MGAEENVMIKIFKTHLPYRFVMDENFSHLHVLKAGHWNSAKVLLPKGSLPFHLQWWCSHTADLRLELPWHYTQMCNEDLNMLYSFSQFKVHLFSNPIPFWNNIRRSQHHTYICTYIYIYIKSKQASFSYSFKNGHQKEMCLKESGLHVQKFLIIILSSIIKHNWERSREFNVMFICQLCDILNFH